MAIDVEKERLIPLDKAAAEMPGVPRSRRTLYRWATVGFRGVKLETVKVGLGLYTSREAMKRFIDGTNRVQKATNG